MQGTSNGQIDFFNHLALQHLIPEDHLLLKIDKIIDFSFVNDIVKDLYSDIGRHSYDPVMLFKVCLLEYLYKLSDVQVVKRIQTDVAFRWFLDLSLYEKVPDDTTISYFRAIRLKDRPFEEFFNKIVEKCIQENLVSAKHLIVDSTDVAANTSFPSDKKLICDAFRKTIKEISKFNESLAKETLKAFEESLDKEYEKGQKVSVKTFANIAKDHAEQLYLHTYDELQENKQYIKAFGLLWDIIHQYLENSKDKIVSTVDPDARVAHKSPGNIKRGYKNHIIVDEESEIILGSTQTPFNVGDEKQLIPLLEKVENDHGIIPEQVTADKVYGTYDNRAYLKDNNISCNIDFYKESSRETSGYLTKDFEISPDLKSTKCPNGVITTFVKTYEDRLTFKFSTNTCKACPLRNNCFPKRDLKKNSGRQVTVNPRYDVMLIARERIETEDFKSAMNKRFKIERRFATQVLNHGLRRCRYLTLTGAKIHIAMANLANNIVRMVNLLSSRKPPSFAMS